MTAEVYLIQCITNLHVGSGDANYGIIDKLVQRDTVYNYPTIHASSLKGALRERFEKIWKDNLNYVEDIFGKKTNSDTEAGSGNCNFLNADLLALPVRCSHKQFALTLCPQSIGFINGKAKMLTESEILRMPTTIDRLFTNENPVGDIFLEDDSIQRAGHSELINGWTTKDFNPFKKQYAIVEDSKYDTYAADLPVVARNRLDENRNLWYEEVVPHQSVFITYFIPNATVDSNAFADFEKNLSEKNFQVGANSSVGYGLCKFHKLTKKEIK